MIELNEKRLIPEKQLASWLENLKSSQKKVYAESVTSYLKESNDLISELKANKKKWSQNHIIKLNS